jgi:hypothetical protein
MHSSTPQLANLELNVGGGHTYIPRGGAVVWLVNIFLGFAHEDR